MIQLAKDISIRSETKETTFGYLFLTFLKIGCVGFGGHMALVSLIQRIMVDNDETLNNEVILDSVTVASLLPGPLAVNVVANIGYHLKGRAGAFISIVGVLLPACILMLLLSWIYFTYSYKIEWAEIMYYVGGTVSAVILSTGLQLYKKEIGKDYKKATVCVLTIITASVANSCIITIALILSGAIIGLLLGRTKYPVNSIADGFRNRGKLKIASSLIIGLFTVNEVLFITGSFKSIPNLILKIGAIFSGISLSLFGGGYVMIPMMQSVFVSELHWLTTRQFVDAVAFSQATPGPILVSSVFIGYKLAGVFGALLASIAMFAPSAILMIMVSRVFTKNKDHKLVKEMIAGVKVVVIGLIAASAIKILMQLHLSVSIAIIGIVSLVLSFKYKISPVYLITASIYIGILIKFLI